MRTPPKPQRWLRLHKRLSRVAHGLLNPCRKISLPTGIFMLLWVLNAAVWTSWQEAAADNPLLTDYNLTYKGQVPSHYGVADGYWHFSVNHTFPVVSSYEQARYRHVNKSCWSLAASLAEPYTPFYHPRQQQAQPLPGGVPRAIFKWEGSISRSLFESVPFTLRDDSKCPHCTYVLRYKVLNGTLYTDMKRRRRALDGQEQEADMVEELIVAALHLFKVPDADFLLHLGDGCPEGLPLLQANINRGFSRAGFTIPKFMWRDSLGPHQLRRYAECLEARHPHAGITGRARRVVWRGSSTDTRYSLVEEGTALNLTRARVALMGVWYPQLFDAALTAFVQQAFDGQCVSTLLNLGSKVPLEDFCKNQVILDVDGNGWSDRYRLIAHLNTPILKQASNLTAYFEHLMAPGVVVEHYHPDLRDMPSRAAHLLQELQEEEGRQRLLGMAELQQGLAHYNLNHVAVAEAMAYAITQAALLSSWKPQQEQGYEAVLPTKCCTHAKTLPKSFVTAVQKGEGAAAAANQH